MKEDVHHKKSGRNTLIIAVLIIAIIAAAIVLVSLKLRDKSISIELGDDVTIGINEGPSWLPSVSNKISADRWNNTAFKECDYNTGKIYILNEYREQSALLTFYYDDAGRLICQEDSLTGAKCSAVDSSKITDCEYIWKGSSFELYAYSYGT